MNEFIKELYSLDYGDSCKNENFYYTRVPGGWICEAYHSDSNGVKALTFIPFVKKEDL